MDCHELYTVSTLLQVFFKGENIKFYRLALIHYVVFTYTIAIVCTNIAVQPYTLYTVCTKTAGDLAGVVLLMLSFG